MDTTCLDIRDWCHAIQSRYGEDAHCHAPIINGVPICSHSQDDDTLLFLTDY